MGRWELWPRAGKNVIHQRTPRGIIQHRVIEKVPKIVRRLVFVYVTAHVGEKINECEVACSLDFLASSDVSENDEYSANQSDVRSIIKI